MALCRDCSTVIPCHCHLAPAAEVRPGVYLADPDQWEETPAQAARYDRHDHRDED
jgi:hypothetical protein